MAATTDFTKIRAAFDAYDEVLDVRHTGYVLAARVRRASRITGTVALALTVLGFMLGSLLLAVPAFLLLLTVTSASRFAFRIIRAAAEQAAQQRLRTHIDNGIIDAHVTI